jgi:hypothetical protein
LPDPTANKSTKAPARNGSTRERRRAQIAAGIVQQKPITKIASELGISREWTSKEANSQETKAIIQRMFRPHHHRLEKVIDRSISNVERALEMDEKHRLQRIEALSERIEKLRQVIKARAEAPESQWAAGGETGLLAHTVKSIGSGLSAETVDEFEVDTGLLKELREHERQLREELNDFTPNLRAVERARDLLEMAEGKTKEDNAGDRDLRFSGTLEDLLILYRRVTTERRPGDRQSDSAVEAPTS